MPSIDSDPHQKVDGFLRIHWTACAGFRGRHAPESLVGLNRIEASKRYADIIIPEGGRNPVALEMVIARLESLLGAENDNRTNH